MSITEQKNYIKKKIPVKLLIQALVPRKVDYKKNKNYGHYVIAYGYNNKRFII